MDPDNKSQQISNHQLQGQYGYRPGQPEGYGPYGPQPGVGGTDPYMPGPPAQAPPPPPPPPRGNPQPVPQAVLGGKPTQKTSPNSTQNALQIAEIRDGIVIMNDGSFRSVIMVRSINFDLMSPEEREAVEFSYQGFLNSLYFPVQIFVRSQRVDMRPYIEKLDKIRAEHDNMLLSLLMEDYVNFISELVGQTNIMDKRFYIVVPYFTVADVTKALTQSKNFFSGLASIFNQKQQQVFINEADLNAAKDELRNRVQALLGALGQAGVQGLPLDTQELIELYYDTYNPDTATRQQIKNFDELNAPVISKGQGLAHQPDLDRELQ